MKAKIENGELKLFKDLPNVIGQTIGFKKATVESLEFHGIFDYEEVDVLEGKEKDTPFYDKKSNKIKFKLKDKNIKEDKNPIEQIESGSL